MTINLYFNNYIPEVNKKEIPCKSGVYCVYAGIFNEENGVIIPKRLLYIGKASDLNERIGGNSHEHYDDFKSRLINGETIIYSYAFLSDEDQRTLAESALIFRMQPPINEISLDKFNYSKTTIVTNGANQLLEKEFTVADD